MRMNKWIFKLTPIVVMVGMFSSESASAGCSSEPFIGSMCVTAASYCPSPNYVKANGALLYINDYTALFSLLGTNFGGNGRTNFKLPDMQGRTTVGTGVGQGLSSIELGAVDGLQSIKLTNDNLPAHSHKVGNGVVMNVNNANVDSAVEIPLFANRGTSNQVPANGESVLHMAGKDDFSANEDAKLYGSRGSTASEHLVGKGAEFTNRQPYVGLTHCIAVFGLYPSRP